MGRSVHGWLLTGSAILALVGAIVSAVFFLQPWRSCDDDDVAAGCAMLPVDAAVMVVSAVVTLTAVGVFVVALLLKERPAAR